MKKSTSKLIVNSCFVIVEFFTAKNHELVCIRKAAVEVPLFSVKDVDNVDFSHSLWSELFRHHSRVLSKEFNTCVYYHSFDVALSIDEVNDEELPEFYMPESFLRRHNLLVVG
jgi:hypothetical protein